MPHASKRCMLLLVLLSAARIYHVIGLTCYHGWVLWKHTCYKSFELSLTWSDAQQSCHNNGGGNLVNIASQTEYNFLATFLARDVSFWIGVHHQDGSIDWSHKKDTDKEHHHKTTSRRQHPSHCYVVTKTGSARREVKNCQEHFRFVCEKNAVASSTMLTSRTSYDNRTSKITPDPWDVLKEESKRVVQLATTTTRNDQRILTSPLSKVSGLINTRADMISGLPTSQSINSESIRSKEPLPNTSNTLDSSSLTPDSSSTEIMDHISIFNHLRNITVRQSSSTTLQALSLNQKKKTWSTSYDNQLYTKCRSDDDYCVSPEVWRGQTTIEQIKVNLNRAHSRLDSLTQHTLLFSSQQTLLEEFFFLVNFFIEGSYSKYWAQLNESICKIVDLVEPFLDTHVQQVRLHNDALFREFSYLDIDIQHIEQHKIEKFQYTDTRGLCNITKITVSNNEAAMESILLATVIMKIPSTVVTVDQSNDSNNTESIVSPVLSFSAYTKDVGVSLKPVFSLRRYDLEIWNKAENTTLISFRCAFWDGQNRMWSTFGCFVLSEDNQSVHCQCNHTTNFAILMQIHQVNITADHAIALSIITYIGCSITLLTQFMAVTVFTFVRSLNSERVFIHRNLCIAIGAAQITFLAGIKAVNYLVVCAVVALALHYCYTAVFIWMLMEGLHLYSKVVQVFGTEKSRITYYMIFGWGVPLILVVISAGADWEGYGTSYSCWLSTRRNTIWAFVCPALAIIIVNVVILAAVVRTVMASAKLNKRGEYDHIRAGIKGTLFLLPLLGLTWIFGLVAVNEELVVFQYLFAIFNSLQGFFVFLFHCVLNTEVRQALKRLKQRRSLQNLSSGSNSQSVLHSSAWLPTKPSEPRLHQPNQVAPQRDEQPAASWSHHRQSRETDDSEITGSSRSSPDTNEMKVIFI